MTSKEALNKLLDLITIEDSYWVEARDSIKIEVYNLIKIIKQDLERLEQFVSIYKNTNQRFTMTIQSKSSILPNPTLEQELLRKEVLENE